jgi:hypothetical protein
MVNDPESGVGGEVDFREPHEVGRYDDDQPV